MAYAAVISLKHTIDRLKNRINIPQILKPAYEECDSLRSLLKKLDDRSSRMIDKSVINELDAKIREAVWKLDDALESSLIPPSQGLEDKSYPMIEIEIDSSLKTLKMLREEYKRVLLQKPLPREEEEDAAAPPIHKSTTVGLSDLSENIMHELLQWPFKDPIVSLVGMAGIGKTHLATQIYHHPLILQHFDLRVWVRVGPKDQIKSMDKKIKNISADIVAQIEGKPIKFKERRQLTFTLIVLDDIWSKEALAYFTEMLNHNTVYLDYGNRNRYLLTTRLQEVLVGRLTTKIHQMPFSNNEESWNLLRRNVFVAEKFFPSQLEKLGRKIAENCEGLPLLILTVANILRGHDVTEEYWKKVAEKKTTTFTDAYEEIYEVLLPSYEYLPQHLKPYFLYMGVFPQSCEIPLSKLINFWVVENFLEPNQHQNLQEIAMESMEDLVSKSLVTALLFLPFLQPILYAHSKLN